MSETSKLKSLRARHSALLTERSTWDPDYIQLAKHFLPRKCRIEGLLKTNVGGLRTDILDGTGIRAARVATAGMHGGMTSPARPWFKLGPQDPSLSTSPSVRMWFDIVQKNMAWLFSRSNFYMAIHQCYNELIVFGTDFMFEHFDQRTGLRFNTLTVGEYVIDVDEDGRVDTVFREQDMTARNIVRMFGADRCSESVLKAYEKASSQNTRFPVVHAILPREERNPLKLNHSNMLYGSYYYEKGSGDNRLTPDFLRESGYKELPGFGARWDVTGQDSYGRSPAMDTLPDAKMLQSIRATHLKQEHKRADPPMAYPSGLVHLNTLPGAKNVVNNLPNGGPSVYPIQQIQPDTNGMIALTQDTRQSIKEGLYNDLFRMLALSNTTRMTATEVAERHEEKLLQLGPVLERLHDEKFSPLIDRTFSLMLEHGMVPQWPEELDGQAMKVEFISLLAQAQKMVATSAVDQLTSYAANLGTVIPEALDAINADEAVDSYAEYLGTETRILNSQEARDGRRQARAQAQQQKEQMEQMAAGAAAAKTASEAKVGGGESSALDAILKGAL